MAEELKKKRKKWFGILASDEFNNVKVGETLASEPSELIGRRVSLNLMALTNDPKKQSYNVLFVVKELKDEDGLTELIRYSMVIAHARRLVRKGISKIEDSFVVETKNNVKYKIKPFLILRFKTQHKVQTSIRKMIREHLTNLFKDIESKDVFMSAISNKIQMDLKSTLRKIYPVNICEIRILERL